MEHLDAKAIRDRLHAISAALTTLEGCSAHPRHAVIAAAGRTALRDIAVLVTDDESEENGARPPRGLQRWRQEIRQKQGRNPGAAT